MEKWTSGTDQKLLVHKRENCVGKICCIHKPTDHHMIDFPQNWRYDRGIMERICPCGVGHPDPDDFQIRHSLDNGIHGCCGCCRTSQGKPNPPLSRILREGDTAEKCHLCGSSLTPRWHKWWRLFKKQKKHCIHPDCNNYIIRALVKEK